jgi:hypothetical protein
MIGFAATFTVDFNFWALIPAVNLNFHSETLEVEWLCFAFYVDFFGDE